jgi:hypothetical protein
MNAMLGTIIAGEERLFGLGKLKHALLCHLLDFTLDDDA